MSKSNGGSLPSLDSFHGEVVNNLLRYFSQYGSRKGFLGCLIACTYLCIYTHYTLKKESAISTVAELLAICYSELHAVGQYSSAGLGCASCH